MRFGGKRWWDYHLYQFDIGRAHYGVPDPEWDPEIGIEVRRARIARLGHAERAYRVLVQVRLW